MAYAEYATAEECKAHIAEAITNDGGQPAAYDVESIYLTAFGYDGTTGKFHIMLGEDGFYATIAQYEN